MHGSSFLRRSVDGILVLATWLAIAVNAQEQSEPRQPAKPAADTDTRAADEVLDIIDPPKLSLARTAIDGSQIALHALSLMGLNYKYGGANVDSGFDCSGFVRHVFRETLGLDLPRSSAEQSQQGRPVNLSELQPGDLVFYNTLKRAFSHVGIYLGEGRFVHSPSQGKQIEIVQMNNRYWKQRFNGARRIAPG